MKQHWVRELEELLEEYIAEALESEDAPKLPKPISPHTIHLMAKGAVTVLEAAQEPEH